MIITNTFFSIFKQKISHVTHIVSYKCNGRCNFCYLANNEIEHEISLSELNNFVIQLPPIDTLQIGGGEPFLYESLFDLISTYIKHTKCRCVLIPTNGSQVEKTISTLAQLTKTFPNVIFRLHLSIDNFPSEHDNSRGIKNLFKSQQAITKSLYSLNRKNLSIFCSICINNSNQTKSIAIKNYIQEHLKIRSFVWTLARDAKGNLLVTPDLRPQMHAAKTFNEYLGLYLQNQYMQNKYYRCYAGKRFFTITPDGKCSPCELTSSFAQIDNTLQKSHFWKTAKEASRSLNRCHCTLECHSITNFLSDKKNYLQYILIWLKFIIKRI